MADKNRSGDQISKILEKKKKRDGVYYLVRWKGLSIKHQSWEKYTNIRMADDKIKEFRQKLADEEVNSKSKPKVTGNKSVTQSQRGKIQKMDVKSKITNKRAKNPLSVKLSKAIKVVSKARTAKKTPVKKMANKASKPAVNRKLTKPTNKAKTTKFVVVKPASQNKKSANSPKSHAGNSSPRTGAKSKLLVKFPSMQAQLKNTLMNGQIKNRSETNPKVSKKNGAPETAESVGDSRKRKLDNNISPCTEALVKAVNVHVRLNRTDMMDQTDSMSSDSEASDLLYSLATDGSESEQSRRIVSLKSIPASRKRLRLDFGAEMSSTNLSTPDSDPEISFRTSPRKLLLKDSMKVKNKSPMKSALPPRDTSPPRGLTSNSDMARIPPIIPNSPAGPSYETLKKNLSCNQRVVRRRNNDCDDDDGEAVERRLSVRNTESAFRYKDIVVKKCPGYTQIGLYSQTKRKNTFNPNVFQEILQALHHAKFDDSRLVLLTGSGTIFSSGLDLEFLTVGDRRVAARKMADAMKDFVNGFITFPKPVVAAVNGPAIGFGVCLLPLCDIVYASDKASFYCPYSRLGQTPEGCSSYTFSHTMGTAMAGELLIGGRKITALEAQQCGLVSQVFWPSAFMQEVTPRIKQLVQYSGKALEASKLLLRSHHLAKMQLTIQTESQMLADRWATSECQRSIIDYMEVEQDLI